jgi:TldD protein
MESKLKKAIKLVDVDYAEIHLEERIKTVVNYVGKELEAIGTNSDLGGNVRAYHKGGWGFVSFNDITNIEDYVRSACRQAKLTSAGEGKLKETPVFEDSVTVKLEDDPREVPLDEKEELMRSYNNIILASRVVQTSQTGYRDTFIRRTFLNTEGSYIREERMYCGVAFTAIAKDGANVQTSRFTTGNTKGFKTAVGLESKVETVTKEAVDLLKAEKVTGGKYPVIANQRLAGVFCHEAFGHLSEADHVYGNEKLRNIMKLGKRFGEDYLSIVDDGTIFGERGYYKYDDEGVKSQKTYLIKDGILGGRLHSRQTAAIMNEPLTGNARAMTYRFKPIVRMSNTYIEPRNKKFEDMVSEINHGIYAIDALGGQTELEMFTFSAAKAYLIKNGKIGPIIRDVILSGNVFETLKNIDAIGDDFELAGSLGGCGKDGQWPLPVSFGSPHIRIRNVIIGGR